MKKKEIKHLSYISPSSEECGIFPEKVIAASEKVESETIDPFIFGPEF